MRCPRCFLADIPEGARTCVLCGYSSDARPAAGGTAQPTPPARPGRGRTTPAGGPTPTDPHGRQAPAALGGQADIVPAALDARRELPPEVRIDELVRPSPPATRHSRSSGAVPAPNATTIGA